MLPSTRIIIFWPVLGSDACNPNSDQSFGMWAYNPNFTAEVYFALRKRPYHVLLYAAAVGEARACAVVYSVVHRDAGRSFLERSVGVVFFFEHNDEVQVLDCFSAGAYVVVLLRWDVSHRRLRASAEELTSCALEIGRERCFPSVWAFPASRVGARLPNGTDWDGRRGWLE